MVEGVSESARMSQRDRRYRPHRCQLRQASAFLIPNNIDPPPSPTPTQGRTPTGLVVMGIRHRLPIHIGLLPSPPTHIIHKQKLHTPPNTSASSSKSPAPTEPPQHHGTLPTSRHHPHRNTSRHHVPPDLSFIFKVTPNPPLTYTHGSVAQW